MGEDAKAKAAALKPGEILLLENLRFDKREEKNDPEFAKELASMAEVYVSDAFGTVHRAHASTAGVAAYLPAVSGFLIGKELDIMGKALDDPKRPFVAVLGGAKVSDKINVINNQMCISDRLRQWPFTGKAPFRGMRSSQGRARAVSYTHLDVYKRQPSAFVV